MLEFENQSAIRAEKNNLLNSKVKNFRTYHFDYPGTTASPSTESGPNPTSTPSPIQYCPLHSGLLPQTQPGFQHPHAQHRLPHQPRKVGQHQGPQRSRHASLPHPQHVRRTPSPTQINTELLMEKRKLEEHILFMKE